MESQSSLKSVSNLKARHADIRALLQALLTDLNEIAKYWGVDLKAPSDLVFQDFLTLPELRQRNIVKNLAITCMVNQEQIPSTPTSGREIPLEREITLLKSALEKIGYEIADADVFNHIADGDIIEVYNAEAVQVYRSWSFFKFCSYSLIDLLVYDWNTLYERPAFAVDYLMNLAPQLFVPGAKTIAYELPEYILTERFLDHDQAFRVKMRVASPLLDKQTGQTAAFISTASVKPLPLGEDMAKIRFL